jgi:hypothetical protein
VSGFFVEEALKAGVAAARDEALAFSASLRLLTIRDVT